MKKYFILLLLLLPTICFGKSINILDLNMDLDEEKNIIVTRDNMVGNEELKKLGFNENELLKKFEELSCYLDAVNREESKEYLVFVKDVDLKRNLHKYKDKDIKKLEDKMIEDFEVFEHNIYSTNDYKYIYMYYVDGIYHVIDYYTAINGKGYTIKYQSSEEITDEEKEDFKKIINNISFKLNSEYEKKISSLDWLKYLVLVIIAFGLGALCAVLKTKSKTKKE